MILNLENWPPEFTQSLLFTHAPHSGLGLLPLSHARPPHKIYTVSVWKQLLDCHLDFQNIFSFALTVDWLIPLITYLKKVVRALCVQPVTSWSAALRLSVCSWVDLSRIHGDSWPLGTMVTSQACSISLLFRSTFFLSPVVSLTWNILTLLT